MAIRAFFEKGGWWVLGQVAAFGVLAASFFLDPGWPRPPWTPAAILLLIVGALIIIMSFIPHGSDLTSLPEPRRAVGLIRSGVYARVRHPMYLGLMLCSLGAAVIQGGWWPLGGVLVLAVFFDFKSRHEEGRLLRAYPEYEEYRRATGRFLPRITFRRRR
ncbi:MAG: isoprenylcysteine carboxylmethyltransferase family protein [Armatimonadetes bacterium]|nr:isoprenylcysteine carboxylmethyltransferase family protein [Armatimonadota bacterium]